MGFYNKYCSLIAHSLLTIVEDAESKDFSKHITGRTVLNQVLWSVQTDLYSKEFHHSNYLIIYSDNTVQCPEDSHAFAALAHTYNIKAHQVKGWMVLNHVAYKNGPVLIRNSTNVATCK